MESSKFSNSILSLEYVKHYKGGENICKKQRGKYVLKHVYKPIILFFLQRGIIRHPKKHLKPINCEVVQ